MIKAGVGRSQCECNEMGAPAQGSEKWGVDWAGLLRFGLLKDGLASRLRLGTGG